MARDLQDRLNLLVDSVFGGNSAAAANAAQMEPSTLHRIMNSRVGDPRLATARRLADSYGVPVAWLIGEADATDSQKGRPLPTPMWLIRCYHDKVQSRSREQLRKAMSDSPAAREVLNGLVELQLFPRDGRTAVPALHVAVDIEKPSKREIELLRALAQVETSLLENAALRVRRGDWTGSE